MYRLLILLLLLVVMDANAQSIERPGKPYMFTQYQGVLGADSGLKAPDRLVVKPGRDSTGLMAVLNGVFYFHTGAGGGWTTPTQAGSFDTTHVYDALADSIAESRRREDSIAVLALGGLNGLRDSALYAEDSDLYLSVWSGAQTYFTKTGFSAALDTIITIGDTADIVAPYTRLVRFVDSIAVIRLLTGSKVNYTDTAAMLSVYARLQALKDTAAAIRAAMPNISGKLNISDTAAMLAGYARLKALADTAAAIRGAIPSVAGKVNYTDTAAMLAGYVRLAAFADSITTMRVLANSKVKYTDTSGMLAPYVLGNRLTDTSNNLRTLTNARVRFTDTAGMLAPYVLGNRLTDTAAALRALSNARIKYTDTAGMLVGYVLSNRFTDTIALTVKKRDSLVLYATPKNVKDSAVSVRAAIPTNNNQLVNGAGYITSTGVVYTTSVQTLTNKRIEFRTTGGASFTTSVAIDIDNFDAFEDSLQAGPLLFAAPSGTPSNKQLLQIWIKDNGTARALTWNAIFSAATGTSLPNTTTISKWLVVLFQYNTRSNKWYMLTSQDNYTP